MLSYFLIAAFQANQLSGSTFLIGAFTLLKTKTNLDLFFIMCWECLRISFHFILNLYLWLVSFFTLFLMFGNFFEKAK